MSLFILYVTNIRCSKFYSTNLVKTSNVLKITPLLVLYGYTNFHPYGCLSGFFVFIVFINNVTNVDNKMQFWGYEQPTLETFDILTFWICLQGSQREFIIVHWLYEKPTTLNIHVTMLAFKCLLCVASCSAFCSATLLLYI